MYDEKCIPKVINDDGNTINSMKVYNDTTRLRNFEIVVSDVTAKWIDTQTDNTLENLNLTVLSNKLIVIIGPVGAGKVLI